jgi:SAM-dependent methyltransferase
MHADIVDLRQFYHTRLGLLAEQSVAMALSSIWANLPGERLMGLGYAAPYLDRFRPDAERTFAFMPAGQGAVNWPARAARRPQPLLFDEELPLADASLDRILMVHSLEFAENPRETLKELWRVLAPGGRLVIVAPNRRGVWARFEHTPFGAGPALFARPAGPAPAREQFHAGRLLPRRCSFRRPKRAVVMRHAGSFRTAWKAHVAGVFRCDRGRGAKAALSGVCRLRSAPRAVCSFRFCRRRPHVPRIARRFEPDTRLRSRGRSQPNAPSALSRQDRCKRLFPRHVLTMDYPQARNRFDEQHRFATSKTRRPGHRRLCSGPRDRAWRGEGLQALIQRNATWSEPQGGRGNRRERHRSGALSRRICACSARCHRACAWT